jgi:Tfp pilus assembly protein PilP
MCKAAIKYIAGCSAGLVLLLAAWPLAAEVMSFAKPQVEYKSQGRRDPFVQPQAGRLRNVMEQVDIEVLKLTGIIRDPQQATALFTARTGPRFGYLLKGGRLFSENHQPLAGISGEITSPNEVVLKQDGRKVVYQLHGQ